MTKRGKTVLGVALAALLVFAAAFALVWALWEAPGGDIYVEDIENLFFLDEGPRLKYADGKRAVLYGRFGVVIYDFKTESVFRRLPMESTALEYGFLGKLLAWVSEDGRTVYFSDDPLFSSQAGFNGTVYRWDLRRDEISPCEKQKAAFDRFAEFNPNTPKTAQESAVAASGKDLPWTAVLYSGFAVDLGDCLLTLRTDPASFIRTQIVRVDKETLKVEAFDVFQ